MAAPTESFDNWLSNKLVTLEIDADVFHSYIVGILEGDESAEEKNEALQGIIQSCVDADSQKVCDEILDRWESASGTQITDKTDAAKFSVEDKLSSMLGKDIPSVARTQKITEEEKQRRDAIVSHYGNVADEGSDGDEDHDDGDYDDDDAGLYKNVNVQSVMNVEKDRREKMKEEMQKKKTRDQQGRDEQKKKVEERKEKEKKRTQKGERRTR
ncbi:PREDICTED: coiled-coil domain-containing protein 43-like [Priapulus caudatus]|uniref:Coiled-coil domain-containing protein 43 n=1 Tax=Priapulus caudatus TaxID=37621 RepID=A0ABM1EZN1_PRICU|nr:PREDICTED: coiled-coil domain-containing protein 43-like [Priapulus caudatus]